MEPLARPAIDAVESREIEFYFFTTPLFAAPELRFRLRFTSDSAASDEDGFIDLVDPGCFGNPLEASEEGDPACADGIDNDDDGFVEI